MPDSPYADSPRISTSPQPTCPTSSTTGVVHPRSFCERLPTSSGKPARDTKLSRGSLQESTPRREIGPPRPLGHERSCGDFWKRTSTRRRSITLWRSSSDRCRRERGPEEDRAGNPPVATPLRARDRLRGGARQRSDSLRFDSPHGNIWLSSPPLVVNRSNAGPIPRLPFRSA